MTHQPALATALNRINQRFVATLSERCLAIDRFLDAGQNARPETCEEALFALHKIAGLAGTLGHVSFGQEARHCEDMLLADLTNTGRPSRETVESIDGLREMAAAILAT